LHKFELFYFAAQTHRVHDGDGLLEPGRLGGLLDAGGHDGRRLPLGAAGAREARRLLRAVDQLETVVARDRAVDRRLASALADLGAVRRRRQRPGRVLGILQNSHHWLQGVGRAATSNLQLLVLPTASMARTVTSMAEFNAIDASDGMKVIWKIGIFKIILLHLGDVADVLNEELDVRFVERNCDLVDRLVRVDGEAEKN